MAVVGHERYIHFVVAFSGRMSERATLRKGWICDKKRAKGGRGECLSDKLEATDRMMMERTQNGAPSLSYDCTFVHKTW